MKKLLFIICIVFAICKTSQAQMAFLFNSEPYERRVELEDSIKLLFPNRTFRRDSSISFKAYGFVLTDSSRKTLKFDFKKFNRGENKDLEAKGVVSIMQVNVYGSFLDLFLVWKTYIDKSANRDEIIERNATGIMIDNKYRLSFIKDAGSWSIETKYQPF